MIAAESTQVAKYDDTSNITLSRLYTLLKVDTANLEGSKTLILQHTVTLIVYEFFQIEHISV